MSLPDLSDYESNKGRTYVRAGCMHGDKTLISIIDAIKINLHSPHRALMYNTDINSRDLVDGESPKVKSAIGLESPCIVIPVNDPWKIMDVLEQENKRTAPDHYGKIGRVHANFFDEGNFYDLRFLEVVDEINEKYPWMMNVIIGLNYNIRQEPFEVMGRAQNKYVALRELEAKCKILKEDGTPCGKSTPYTARLVNLNKVSGYSGFPVGVVDKFGNKIDGDYTFEPIFSPIIMPEERDESKTEAKKTRLYTNACSDHFELPYKKEAKEVENFIKISILGGYSLEKQDCVPLNIVVNKFSNLKYLDQVLRYLTEEKGIKYEDKNFSLRKYVQGTFYEKYLPHPDENLSVGVYKPGLKIELL